MSSARKKTHLSLSLFLSTPFFFFFLLFFLTQKRTQIQNQSPKFPTMDEESSAAMQSMNTEQTNLNSPTPKSSRKGGLLTMPFIIGTY